jgi:hypothetical protein
VLDLSCNLTGYDVSLNEARIEVTPPPDSSVGYTFSEYIAAINTGFAALAASGSSLNINNSGITIDSNNYANLSFDYNLTFVNSDYTIDLSGGLQFLNIGPVFPFVADLGVTSTFTNNIGFRSEYDVVLDASGNAVLFNILPKSGHGNQNAGIFQVPLLKSNGTLAGSLYSYSNIYKFLTDYNNSINFFVDTYGSQVLGGSSLTVASGVSGYTLTLQVNVLKSLTQNQFNLALYDLSGSSQVFDGSTWQTYLKFLSREYVLSSAVQSPPSSVVVSSSAISDTTGTITLVDGSNNYFYFRPQTYADGLWTAVAGSYLGSD